MSVVVVGAGPSGLVAACALAQRNVAVRIVDRASEPARTSRANILHARGVEVLERVGAEEGLRELALAPVGMVMHSGTVPLATMRFAPNGQEKTQALFVSQAAVEERLRHRLAELDVTIEWGVEIKEVRQDTSGVALLTAGDERIDVDWVVGCDGAGSTVRHAADIAFPGVPVVERFLLADVVVDWDRDRSTSHGWFTRSGVLLAIPQTDPLTGEPSWRLMADTEPTPTRLSPDDIVAQLIAALGQRAGQHSVDVRRTVWTSVFSIHRRLAATYRSGRLLLAGDAAHTHSPIGGQGMTTGMGDAENLAWKLAMVSSGRAGSELLDSYTAERRPLAVDVLRNTTGNTRILTGSSWASRTLRDRIFIPLLRSPAVQQAATRKASQLGLSYRRGPLATGIRADGRGPSPGDRVPDMPVSGWDGTCGRLYELLRSGWVLVAASQATEAAVLTQIGPLFGRLSTVTSDVCGADHAWLIRPDGHLAWRGRPGHPSLDAVLTRLRAR